MAELRRRVLQFLMTANLPGLRDIRVDAQGDSVVLTGCVRTFYEKQMATEFARRVAGVVSVLNSIDVRVAAASDAGTVHLDDTDKHRLETDHRKPAVSLFGQ